MTGRVLAVLVAWLALAVLAGAGGLLAGVRPPFPQVVLAVLTLALLAAVRRVPTLRAWALAIDIRALVLFHVTRFVGIYFLVLHARGALPRAFAVPYGIGDIVVAAGALLVAALAPRHGTAGWTVYAAWNTAGLVDILAVVVTAGRLGMAESASMRALMVLPLSLLPTFVVPIIVASHVVIFARLARSRRDAGHPL